MPRQKFTSTRRTPFPTRVQDGTGLGDRISETIIGTFVAPIDERVTVIESSLGLLEIQRGAIQQADVSLRRGGRGGTVIVDLPLPVVDDALGRPLLVSQVTRGDEDELGIVLFTGDVMDKRHLRLRWFCGFPAPASVQVVYLIA